jgi:hypothetical protein
LKEGDYQSDEDEEGGPQTQKKKKTNKFLEK